MVHAAYGYAISIRNLGGSSVQRPAKTFRSTVGQYGKDLNEVFAYTEMVFSNIGEVDLE